MRRKFRGTGRFAKPANKFGAKKITIDGITFDSLKEGKRYEELKLLQKAGKIFDLTLQPTYKIIVNDILVCKVKLDFEYMDAESNQLITEDVKGLDNPVSKLKRKLVFAHHGVEVRLT